MQFHIIYIQAPTICPGYQKGTHNVTIYDGNGSLVHQFDSIEYTQEDNGEKSHIVKEMTSGLVYSKNYTVEVMTSSLGVMRSKRDSFCKQTCVVSGRLHK